MTKETWLQRRRQERMRLLLQKLKESPQNIEKVKARFGFDYGLRPNVVEEYYNQLIKAGLLNDDKNE